MYARASLVCMCVCACACARACRRAYDQRATRIINAGIRSVRASCLTSVYLWHAHADYSRVCALATRAYSGAPPVPVLAHARHASGPSLSLSVCMRVLRVRACVCLRAERFFNEDAARKDEPDNPAYIALVDITGTRACERVCPRDSLQSMHALVCIRRVQSHPCRCRSHSCHRCAYVGIDCMHAALGTPAHVRTCALETLANLARTQCHHPCTCPRDSSHSMHALLHAPVRMQTVARPSQLRSRSFASPARMPPDGLAA